MRKEMCRSLNLRGPEVVGNPNQPASDMYILKSQMVALELENIKIKKKLVVLEEILVELVSKVEFRSEPEWRKYD